MTFAGDVWEGRNAFLLLFCRVRLLPLGGRKIRGLFGVYLFVVVLNSHRGQIQAFG